MPRTVPRATLLRPRLRVPLIGQRAPGKMPLPKGSVLLILALGLLGGAAPLGVAQSGRLERDPFATGVSEALDRGSRFLVKSLRRDRYDKSYPMGQRALFAYALVESGVGRSSMIEELFEELDDLPLRKSYAVAVYVMALDASLRKDPEPWKKRRFKPRQERLLQGVEWLIRARYWKHGMWGYDAFGRSRPSGSWVDFSVTQFATLALQVALKRNLKIPTEVLQEIAKAHAAGALAAAQGVGRIGCEGAGWWSDSGQLPVGIRGAHTTLEGTAVLFSGQGFSVQGTPRGWPYTPATRSNPKPRITYSMTAAAVSSMIVAREGLARQGKLNDAASQELDRLIAEGVLTLRRDWSQLTPSGFGSLLRNYYYTLYSFEKAMDLGGIGQLGDIDWYPQQARTLMTTQRGDGGWGSKPGETEVYYDRVSTSFALLFLCRATRNLRIKPPEPIVTGSKEKSWSVAQGTIYLPSTAGVVELSELFGILADQRSSVMLVRAQEVMSVAAPEEMGHLVPYLLELRESGSGDAVYRFSSQGLALICGASITKATALNSWYEEWRSLRESTDSSQLARVLSLVSDGSEPVTLRRVGIELLERWGTLEGVLPLLTLLTDSDPVLRRAAIRGLRTLTLENFPFDPEGEPASQGESVARWRRYWDKNGVELLFRQKWLALREQLDGAKDPRERARLCSEIVSLGPKVLPELDAILAGHSYAFDWVLIREALTREQEGI